jgi:hypothetical protein
VGRHPCVSELGELRPGCLHASLNLDPVPVMFLELPVVILIALYPGLFSLSQLAR